MSNHDKSYIDKMNLDNIQKYIGLNLLMGIIRIPQIDDYWLHSEFYNFPAFRKSLSKHLFYFIGKYIHFNDNNKLELSKDKLFKIRPIYEDLSQKWIKYQFKTNKFTVDETMIHWRGRLGIRQYIFLVSQRSMV